MQFPSPKIKYYKTRSFGEKINVSFDFLRETWKPLLKYTCYLILPICLIQAFATNSYIHLALSMSSNSVMGDEWNLITNLILSYGILMLCVLTGTCLLSALIYTLMQEYEKRETRLLDITFSDFKSLLIKNLSKTILVSVFTFFATIFICIIIGLLAALSLWTLVLTIPALLIALIAVMIPLSYFIPVYILEDKPFFESLQKSFKMGFSVWTETFAVSFVFGLLGSIVSSVTTAPWYIVVVFGELFSLASPESISSSWWYQVIAYLLGIVQSSGVYFSSIISVIGLAFQYFHVREKREGISVTANINNFEQL